MKPTCPLALIVLQLIGVLAGGGTAPTANAAVLVSNIAESTKGTTTVPTDAGQAAQSFATDAGSHALTSVVIVAGNFNSVGGIVAELRAGTVNSVGATIGSFVVPPVTTGSPAMLTLTPNTLSSTFSLAPSTYYWLVLGTTGGAVFGWDYALGNVITGPGSLGNYAYSSDSGVTWGSFNSDDPYRIEVNVGVAPVPVPATVWLFGSGLASLLSLPKMRRRMFAS